MRGAAALAALALAGCATDRVTLLDNEPGHDTGAVAVLSTKGETVLDQANSQAALRDGPTRVRRIEQVPAAYTTVLGDLPPGPRTFTFTFPVGEAQIPEDQRGKLEEVRKELQSRPGAQIEVAGFTDSTGQDDDNDALSRKRAEEVAEQLRGFGFQIDAGDAVGRGEREAKAKLGDGVESPEYRRVDVIVR